MDAYSYTELNNKRRESQIGQPVDAMDGSAFTAPMGY